MKKTTNKWLIILLCLILGGTLFYHTEKNTSIQQIPILLTIGNKVGIDVNTTAITFGTVKPGTQAERTVILRGERKEKILLAVKGIPFVTITEQILLIEKDEIKKVVIIAAPPKTAELKTYEGVLTIKSKQL